MKTPPCFFDVSSGGNEDGDSGHELRNLHAILLPFLKAKSLLFGMNV